MTIKPVLTEKTMHEASAHGHYTFSVPVNFTKHQIKVLIGKAYGVDVVNISTHNKKGRLKSTLTRKKVKVSPMKKAIVKLKDKQKIDVFESDSK
jgi:ribosomal protein L23